MHRARRHPAGHQENEERHGESGQRLSLAVAVGMVRIRRLRRDAEARPHEQRGEDVEHRLRRIGDERVGVAEDATRELHGGEHGVQRDATQHQPRALVGATGDGELDLGHGHRRTLARIFHSGNVILAENIQRPAGPSPHRSTSALTTRLAGTTFAALSMPETATPFATDPVKQFSVFIENRVGRLHDLVALLAKHNVHIMAMTTIDQTDTALDRMIVDDPDRARELMAANNFFFTECEVIAVEFTDESQLSAVLNALLTVEVNIHYAYSFLMRPRGRSALALSVEDNDLAASALNTSGFKVLTQRDISR